MSWYMPVYRLRGVDLRFFQTREAKSRVNQVFASNNWAAAEEDNISGEWAKPPVHESAFTVTRRGASQGADDEY